MKILLASADLDDIAWASSNGFLDGVMTTPTLLREQDRDERDQLAEIFRVVDAPVYVTVRSVDGQDTYRDGKELARISDQIVVQIPLIEDALAAVRRLANDGVRVASLLVFNAAQGLLAAKAGACCVVTPIDHLDQVGHSGIEIVGELRAAFDASGTECDIIALRPTTAMQFAACALAGADAVAVGASELRHLLVHPLTDRGIDQFLSELARHRPVWSPA
ncbi:MAG TPA: transaldolase family protein [Gemmatimonadaceae bacterium]|nr:transaldolase family protein [Gemmatimonadaceae bacterium]